MSLVYGASRDDWSHWDLVLGLGDDLLPVVSQPGLTLAPSSQLKTYGKVPSRFDRHGHVVGFPGWTQHVATPHELETWPQDNRLGICLQTRRIRAIDVDIEHEDSAADTRECLEIWAAERGLTFSFRIRPNSAKWLTLFALEGEYGKQILQTEHGAVELLMGGQQCVVAGTHSSGSPYIWEEGLPTRIPVLTPQWFEDLKTRLRFRLTTDTADWSEGRVRKARVTGVTQEIDDPVAQFLIDKGWVRS